MQRDYILQLGCKFKCNEINKAFEFTFLSCKLTHCVCLALNLPWASTLPPAQVPDYPSIPFLSSGSDKLPIRRQHGEEYDSRLACGGKGVEYLKPSPNNSSELWNEYKRRGEFTHPVSFSTAFSVPPLPPYFSLATYARAHLFSSAFLLHTCSVSEKCFLCLIPLALHSPDSPRLSVCIRLLTLDGALAGLQLSPKHSLKYTVARCCQSQGGQAGFWRKEMNYALCHTYPRTSAYVHTHIRTH